MMSRGLTYLFFCWIATFAEYLSVRQLSQSGESLDMVATIGCDALLRGDTREAPDALLGLSDKFERSSTR
jgi:hypothetical protein